MTDAAFLELLAGSEALAESTARVLRVLQQFAEAHQDGRRLPDAVVDSYIQQADRAGEDLARFRLLIVEFKGADSDALKMGRVVCR